MSFKTAYSHTMAIEGGYNFYSADSKGGETYRGISRIQNPQWEGWPLIDKYKASLPGPWRNNPLAWAPLDRMATKDKILTELEQNFYHDDFYLPYKHLPERLADKMFDTAVNVGHSRAVRILQESLNCLLPETAKLKLDGALGLKTKAALERVGIDPLLKRYAAYQRRFYELWLATERAKPFRKSAQAFYNRAAWIPSLIPIGE